ncbi:prolyl 4-hydroxylase subunit alpha-1-like [Lineus longissimus]|uniref:prolyl 4-hydroxylase subunit alpha-1-like n=1 Tax=Lineus longissimus TaxID=88925 RepID=UPI00315D9AEC
MVQPLKMHLPVCSWLTFCLVIVHISVSDAETFSSIQSITESFRHEAKMMSEIYDSLQQVSPGNDTYGVTQFRMFINDTKRFFEQFKDEEHVETYLKHPINIYHFIRRCAVEWVKRTLPLIKAQDATISNIYEKLKTTFDEDRLWPRREDLVGVSLSLIRLQVTYLLDFKELATGTLNGTKTDPLTVDELHEIAMVALEKWKPKKAILWLNETAQIIRDGDDFRYAFIYLYRFHRQMAEIHEKFGDYETAVRVAKELVAFDPANVAATNYLASLKEKAGALQSLALTDKSAKSDTKYEALCRGDLEKPPAEVKELKCYFRRSAIPYRPTKVELINLTPEMLIYHDIIYKDEIDRIKEFSKQHLKRSKITTMAEDGIDTSDMRVSRHAWFNIKDSTMEKVYRRVEEITGLGTELNSVADHPYNEDMQVVNYGPGGFYTPHHDFFYPPDHHIAWDTLLDDDRYATLLFYLEDVHIGGATAFPTAEARVPAVKGSAAFWWNMHRNGTSDARTLHAGCPVQIGSKWIGTIWFRYVAQWSHRPCTTNNYE